MQYKENITFWVLKLTALLFLPLSILVPLGEAALGIITIILVSACVLNKEVIRQLYSGIREGGYMPVFIASFFIWAFASSIWSFEISRSIIVAAKVSGMLIGGYLIVYTVNSLSNNKKKVIIKFAIIGFFITCFLLFIEIFFNLPLTTIFTDWRIDRVFEVSKARVNRSFTLLVIMLWPVSYFLWQKNKAITASVVVFVLIMCVNSYSAASVVAVSLSCIAAICMLVVCKFSKYVMIPAILLMIMTPAILSQFNIEAVLSEKLYASIMARMGIWDFTLEKIGERPVIGWGMDASRYISSHIVGNPETRHYMPLHPHNMALQIWLELGIVGLLGLFAIISMLVIQIMEFDNKYIRAAYFNTLLSSLVILSSSYGIWQSWWVMSLCLIFVFTRLIIPVEKGGYK